MSDLTASISKASPAGLNRHILKQPEEYQQQKLSYQTNKLAQYVELQLSDLQNTLHYIQKKHSINQIKESISHAYSIFSQTQPVFRELRIVFIYDKIKKLVNCFSIVYLILMEHIEKPSRITLETQRPKNNQLPEASNQQGQATKNVVRTEINKASMSQSEAQSSSNGTKKSKPLGGVHLYNQQYNRHIESDLDRMKRKLKEQAKESQQSKAKVSQKDKFKEEVLKEINTDVFGTPSPDELTLFFNLNSNRYGSELQYLTFQDELQEIATFFKQSQDEALEFLSKSRDDFIFLNFNQGFKEIMVQYKIEKQEQVNGFIGKVKNLFQAIKIKTNERQKQIHHQINQLNKIQQRIIKPSSSQIQTQTSFNFEEQVNRLKKKIQEVQTNYKELQNYHSKENQNDSKNITFLQHKIAFKEHQLSIIKKQLEEKNHFIDFLNEKINNGTDLKVLRKISNIYRNHSKKNSSKIKVQLEQIQKEAAIEHIGLKQKGSLPSNQDEEQIPKRENSERQDEDPEERLKVLDRKSMMMPFQDYEKPTKKKRKQGNSFFASPEKRFTTNIERNASFNLQNGKIEEQKSDLQNASSADMPLYAQEYEANNQKSGQQGSFKKDKLAKNFVKPDRRKSQDRNSLQVVHKSKSKNFEPKRSAFASSMPNSKVMQNAASRFGINKRDSSIMNEDISEESARQNFEEQELMRQINGMDNQNNESFDDRDHENEYDPDGNENDMPFDEEDINCDEINEDDDNWQYKLKNKHTSIKSGGGKPQFGQSTKNKLFDQTNNLDSDTNSKITIQKRGNSFLKPPSQQTEPYNTSPFNRKQSGIESSPFDQNSSRRSRQMMGKNTPESVGRYQLKLPVQSTNQRTKKGIQHRLKHSFSNQQNAADEQFQEYKIKKRKNKFQSQGLEENYDEENSDFCDEDDQSELSQDQMTRLLRTVSGDSNFDALSSQQKDNMISNYFTTIYKQKKIKSSNLCSRLIDISISQHEAKPISNQSKNNNLQSLQNAQKEAKKSNTANLKSRASELKDKLKYSSSGSLSDSKKQRGKLSELGVGDQLVKLGENNRMSQNINLAVNLTTFKNITVTPEVREQEDLTQRQTKECKDEESEPKQMQPDKKQMVSTDYERIYGISTTSWNRNKRQNTDLDQMSPQERQKVEDFLEKTAMKAAMKAKNVEEFKAKIKKMHMSKCGQNCKHLERYLENFHKYRSSNRQTMKIHIENVHSLIPGQTIGKSNKQNSVTLPSINIMGPAQSSKGFGSIQRNLGMVLKK